MYRGQGWGGGEAGGGVGGDLAVGALETGTVSFQGLRQSGGVRVCRWQRGAEQLRGGSRSSHLRGTEKV